MAPITTTIDQGCGCRPMQHGLPIHTEPSRRLPLRTLQKRAANCKLRRGPQHPWGSNSPWPLSLILTTATYLRLRLHNSTRAKIEQSLISSRHWLRSHRTSSYVTGEDHHDAPSTQDTNRYPSKLCEPSVHCCVTCEDQHDVPSSNAKNAAETFKNTHTHTQAEAYTQKHKYTQTPTHTYTCKTQTQLQDKHTHTHTHTRAYSQNHTLRRITHFLHLWVMSLRSPKIRIFCGYVQIWIWHFVDFGAMLHRS